MTENNENMTEQKYLELADNFKEQMDEKDYELQKIKKDHELVARGFASDCIDEL